jgi:hypothetical protein
MPLPVFPSLISLGQIQGEFGGGAPIAISEYYNGGIYVSNNITAIAPNVPSGGPIRFSNFYGSGKLFDVTFDVSRNAGNYNEFYFTTALGTVTVGLAGAQNQSGNVTVKFIKNIDYLITANVSRIRLTGNTIELEDANDNDYNDLQATPRQGIIFQVGPNFYYRLS